MTTDFDRARVELKEQQGASEVGRGLAKETEQHSEAASKHLTEIATGVSTQLEAAKAKLSEGDRATMAKVAIGTPAESVTEAVAELDTEANVQTVPSGENPFVPAKTKAKAAAAKGKVPGKDSASQRRFGQKIENAR